MEWHNDAMQPHNWTHPCCRTITLRPFLFTWVLLSAVLVGLLAGCGGAGPNGGGGGGGIQSGSFTLNVTPSTLTISTSAEQKLTVSVNALNGFAGAVTCTLGALPSGVTATPASISQSGAGSQQIQFSVSSSASLGSSTITVFGSSGTLSAQAKFTLTVQAGGSTNPVSLTTADQMVRTDALTPYTAYPEPNYLVYHAATNRFFSTDAYLNQLNVVDATLHTLTATITIPGAFGLDQAPDGSVLYVGTLLGDLYVVDPVHLTILKRYASNTISPYGFSANAVYALADGNLLLEQYFLVPGYSWVDGNGPLAVWNPTTNAISVLTTPDNANGSLPETPSCLAKFENVILTNNRTRVMLAPVLTSEGSSVLCSLDPEAGTWNWSPEITGGSNSALTAFAVTSDGNTLVAYDGFNVYVLDAATFAQKSSFPVTTTQLVLNYPVIFLSQDNTKVFLPDPNGADVLDVYDLATGKLTGWIPETNISSPDSYATISPFYQAISSDGLAAGVISGGGIGLLDTTAIHALPIGSRFTQTQLGAPYGPVAGGTSTSWFANEVGVPPAPLGSAYFGANAATGLDENAETDTLAAVSPAGTPGPVDVRTFATDGGSQFLPDGFSYGPWVLEAATSYSTAEGGGPASLYGFGFGPQLSQGFIGYATPPSDLQVSVAGSSAPVTGYSPDPYGNNFFIAPPLPTNALLYTVPAGEAGTTASISVTNASGSVTASTRMTYLPAVQQYSVDGQLADGVYDPGRDVYYFTDANQIRVFSLTQGAWLNPIPIPAPKGAYGPQRLLGIALSPDGSKLAVSDPGAVAIYIINPDQPSSIQSFTYGNQILTGANTEEPAGVAITNNGTVYFATFDLNGDGGSGYLYVLNPTTGNVSQAIGSGLSLYLPTEGANPSGRLAITADGTRIYLNDDGILGYVDTASGAFVVPPLGDSYIGQGDYELVLGANQTRLFVDGFLTDSNLNSVGLQTLDYAESVDADYVYGAALSADGSLLFQPGAQFIDVFDGNTGSFRSRISLPMQLSPNFRALVSNNKDSQLVAITGATGNGIAVIDLNSLPEPAPLLYLSAASRRRSSLAQSHTAQSVAFNRTTVPTKFSLLPAIHRRHSALFAFPTRSRKTGMVANPFQ